MYLKLMLLLISNYVNKTHSLITDILFIPHTSFIKCTLILLVEVNKLLTESGSETTGGEQLNMEQMAGIFIVFAAGIGLGLICMLFEYLFAASADTFKDNIEGVCVKIILDF